MQIPKIKIGAEFTITPADRALAMSLMPNSRPDSYSSKQKFGFYVEANQIRHFKQFAGFENGQVSAPGAVQDFVNGDTHFDFKCIVEPRAHTITVSAAEYDGAVNATDGNPRITFLYGIYRATSDTAFKFCGFLDFTECAYLFNSSRFNDGLYLEFADVRELLFDYQTV